MEWAAAEAEFHVVDVETMRLLGDMSPSQGQVLTNDSNFCFRKFIVHRVQKLSMTLRRPLAFFHIHETSSLIGNAHSSPKLEVTPGAHTVCPSSLHAGFPSLRRFTLWLDHTGIEYWSAVNERALLTPILREVAAYPSFNFVIILPKTHPTLADNRRHYLDNTLETDDKGTTSSSASATLHRVYRQRLRDGQAGRVEYIQDFPHLLSHSFCQGRTMAEVEEIETANWDRGVDTIKQLGTTNFGLGEPFYVNRRRWRRMR